MYCNAASCWQLRSTRSAHLLTMNINNSLQALLTNHEYHQFLAHRTRWNNGWWLMSAIQTVITEQWALTCGFWEWEKHDDEEGTLCPIMEQTSHTQRSQEILCPRMKQKPKITRDPMSIMRQKPNKSREALCPIMEHKTNIPKDPMPIMKQKQKSNTTLCLG